MVFLNNACLGCMVVSVVVITFLALFCMRWYMLLATSGRKLDNLRVINFWENRSLVGIERCVIMILGLRVLE